MPFSEETKRFSRVWSFADQFDAGEVAMRANFDTALADFTAGLNDAVEYLEGAIDAVAPGANPSAQQHFSARSVAQATYVGANVKRITVAHNGMILTYERDSTSTALTTAGGTTWGPVIGSFAFLQHWGVDTFANQADALAAGLAMTAGARTTQQARMTAALAETGGELVIHGWTEFFDSIDIHRGRIIRLARGMPFDGLVVSSRFNLAAPYMLKGGNASSGCTIESLQIWCDQPQAPANRAALTPYPWALSIADVPHGTIGLFRVSGGWRCINGVGNCGGWTIDTVEDGCFTDGGNFNGAMDFVNIRQWHSWWFGFAANPTLTTIAADGTRRGLIIGRMDGLKIDSAEMFQAAVVIDDATGIHAIKIDTLTLDGSQARLTLGRGETKIGALLGKETLTTPELPWKVYSPNGKHVIGSGSIDGDSNALILVEGGDVTFTGRLYNANLTVSQGAKVSSGTLRLLDCRAEWPAGARTLPFIEQAGTGVLQIEGLTVAASTAGEAVKFNTDVAGSYAILDGIFPHTLTPPSGSHVGRYGRNQRADLVERCAAGWRAPVGEVIWANGLQYIGTASATTLNLAEYELPGLMPADFFVAPDHFGLKTRAAVSAAGTYVNSLNTTGIAADFSNATAVPLAFLNGVYDCSDGSTTAPLIYTTAGSRQRIEWRGMGRVKGLSIRVTRKLCEILDPFLDGTGFQMDYGIRFEPDSGEAFRGGFVRHPNIVNVQKADLSAKAIQAWGDATHIEVLGGWLDSNDTSVWSMIKTVGEAVGGFLITGTHLGTASKNHFYLGSIGECRPTNMRIRGAAREGVLIEGGAAATLEQYFNGCSITGNHTDLSTRESWAITSVTNVGGFARFFVASPNKLWSGLRSVRIGGTGVAGYDNATNIQCDTVTSTYIQTNLAYVSNATGTFYHCGWDVKLIGAGTVGQVNDIQFIGGNINSIGLFDCLNVYFMGTRLKVNAWSTNVQRIYRNGPLRGRADDTWEDVPFVGVNFGVYEMGVSVPDGADRNTKGTLTMRTPSDSVALVGNRPAAYQGVGVHPTYGIELESSAGKIWLNDTAVFPSLKRMGARTLQPFVIVCAGQSNADGRGTGQSLTIPANTLMYSTMSGAAGGTMITPAYGTAPLNRDDAGLVTAVAADSRGHVGIAMAREIRTLGLIPAERPIYIIPNSTGGLNISAWIDAPNTMRTNLQAALAVAETTYGAAITIDAFVWIQGEKNGVSGELYSTDATYYDALRVHFDWLKALPQWHMETSVLICELMAARLFLATDTGLIQDHGHQRNMALRRFAVTAKDMKVALIPTGDLVPSGTENDDRAHFSGLSLDTIGYRGAGLHRDLRVGSVQGTPVAADGRPVLIYKELSFASETVYLGKTDLQSGHVNIYLTDSDIYLPEMETGESAIVRVHVGSSGGSPTMNPPRGGYFDGPGGLVEQVALVAGIYEFWWSNGQWKFGSILPRRGSYLDYTEATLSASTILGLTQRSARGRLIPMQGGCRIGLPNAEDGARITLNMRSTSGGDSIIGRACHSAVIAAGGTGHVVGDIITVGLGGATGTSITARVNAVSAGAITSFVLETTGCITSTAAPTNPVAQASTTGVGTGATFTLTYSANPIFGPFIGYSAFIYTMTNADQVVELAASDGYWHVLTDNRGGPGGSVTQITSKATGVTLNTPKGLVTTDAAALGAGASVEFTVTNSYAGINDMIGAEVRSPVSKYTVTVVGKTAGTFILRLTNYTGGSLSEAVLLNVEVRKGAIT